jgi:ATP-dependent exoDNAse (exonuclease V) beta subunit
MDLDRLERMLKPAQSQRHSPAFSITQLRDFTRCRRLYYVRHVLGLRLDERPMFPEDMQNHERDDEDGSGDQRVLGIVVHRLLEQFGKPTSTTLDDVARRAARNETLDDSKAEELAQRAMQIVRSFEQSDTGAALLGAGSLGELSFTLPLDRAVVQGRIDRLITDAPPLVVDFKVPGDPQKVTRESQEADYGLQLRAYALAASRLLGAEVVRAAIVLPETRKQFEWEYGAEEFRQVEGELVERIRGIIEAEQRDAFGPEYGCGECAVCRGQCAGAVTRT